MKELPEILPALFALDGIPEKTQIARLLAMAALDLGLTGRKSKPADATVAAMARGGRNDDERMQAVALQPRSQTAPFRGR